MNTQTEVTVHCQNDSFNNAGADENIKSAQIVYIFGPSGTGKTFTGDYMDIVHGYHHVDGDMPFKNMTTVPEYKEMYENMMIRGDWTPFTSELARLTLEAAKEHKKVVLSHATPGNEHRDYVVKKLIEGGASKDNITLIQLTIDPVVKARGLFHRNKMHAEQTGMAIEELLKNGNYEWEGEMTEETFVEMYLKIEARFVGTVYEFKDHPDAIKVDVSGRDVTHFDNLDKALKLKRSSDLTYESICTEVKSIEVARDEKAAEVGFHEAVAELFAKAKAARTRANAPENNEEREEEEKLGGMKRNVSSVGELEVSVRSLSVG